jgi:NADP-dependent 3-hydroxy acid dehydrogenase YdfG
VTDPSAPHPSTPHPSTLGRPLDGRLAVVTGASRGIGRATVRALANLGARVVAGARAEAELAAVAAEHDHVHALPLDVADPGSVRAFAAAVRREHGAVDVLVANAGIGAFGPIETTTLEDWDRVFDVNVRGTFLVVQAFLADVRARRGHVVLVTSDVSARTFAGGALYTASKHAQRAFARALQMEVEGDGVRVTEVRPGVVATAFGNGTERPAEHGALESADVADAIAFAVTRPARMRLDEIHFHPMGQKAEY